METRLSNYAVQWTGLALLAPAADRDVGLVVPLAVGGFRGQVEV